MTQTEATSPRDFLSRLLSLPGVLAFWVLHGVAHSALRLSLTRTLTLDDGRANELVQNFALGYQVRQPPLYEWLLWCSQQLLGTGIESHLLVRYGLIAGIGLATFGAVRAAVKDDRWAAAASLSLAFSYPVGWTFHEWATQTLLLCIACMATIHAAIRYFETPSVRTAIWLGLAIALGFYAKFSYPLFLGGLLLAAMSMPETRRRLLDPRILLAPLVALLLLSPYLFWVLQVKASMVGEIARHMIQDSRSHVVRAIIGLGRLVRSMPSFLLPWLLFVAVLAPKAFWRAPEGAPRASMAERLALRTMLFAALIVAIGIAASGSTTVRVLYMHVILFIAPVYVFARIARFHAGTAADVLRKFAVVALIAELVIFGIRIAGATDNALTRRMNRGIANDYADLEAAFRQRGIVNGTVVGMGVREVGNLRAVFPDLRILAAGSFRSERPLRRPSDERSCVVIWNQEQEEDIRQFTGIDPSKGERIEAASRSSRVARRPLVWFIARVDPASPYCR